MIDKKRFFIGIAILMGSCIGAGILGLPYVAAQSGFFIALLYIILVGGIIMLANLYLGEICLRTKGKHQIIKYSQKYLGKNSANAMKFAVFFGIYSSMVAYILGIGESLSFLFLGNLNQTILFGLIFGGFMSLLLWRGMLAFKRYEKYGVAIILGLLIVIFFVFAGEVETSNLNYFNFGNIFLPFGVVLFALISFHVIPAISIYLKKNKKIMKNILIFGTLGSMIIYAFFTLLVVGSQGMNTPEVATLSLGKIFVFLGILTMFTSYLAIGNALDENYLYDRGFNKRKAWFFSAIVPMLLFLLTRIFDFFTFTKIIAIGGVISGGMIAVLILFMIKNAKIRGDRKPEYSIPINWFIIGFLILVFLGGVIREVFVALS
jgi:tyrosine-specific transport protein